MLDPRLVPWNAVLAGLIVALLLSAAGFLLRRFRPLALALLSIAPVAGWTGSIWKLNGRLPAFPPLDAPLWSLYFAVAGVLISGLGMWKRGCSSCIGALARAAYLPLLFLLLFKPVFVWAAASLAWKGLAFGLTGMGIMGVWHRKAGRWPAAEYAPWVLGLTAASVCLAVTGTASVSLLALCLAFAAMPPAAAMLADSFGRHHLTREAEQAELAMVDGVLTDVEILGEPETRLAKWRPPDSQSITLPLAFALPALICSGPLYASTPWSMACLVLATPVAGFIGLRLMTRVVTRHELKARRRIANGKLELVAILLALLTAGIPAAIVITHAMQKSAEEESLY